MWGIQNSVSNRTTQKEPELPDIEIIYDPNEGWEYYPAGKVYPRSIYEDAIDYQIGRVKSQRRFNLQERNAYSGSDIGGYIYAEENGFSLESHINPNQADPRAGNPQPGLFSGAYDELPDDIAGLVVATKPYAGESYIQRELATYLSLARRINAPVFVVPYNHFSGDSVYQFNPGTNTCVVYKDGGSCF